MTSNETRPDRHGPEIFFDSRQRIKVLDERGDRPIQPLDLRVAGLDQVILIGRVRAGTKAQVISSPFFLFRHLDATGPHEEKPMAQIAGTVRAKAHPTRESPYRRPARPRSAGRPLSIPASAR